MRGARQDPTGRGAILDGQKRLYKNRKIGGYYKMKKFIPLKENNAGANFLKIETYYNLGGYNCFTYRAESRGYYISVSPVRRETRDGVTFESYTAFSGIKDYLLQVSRKSKKAEETAEKIASEREKDLIDYVCTRQGLAVQE